MTRTLSLSSWLPAQGAESAMCSGNAYGNTKEGATREAGELPRDMRMQGFTRLGSGVQEYIPGREATGVKAGRGERQGAWCGEEQATSV